MRETAKEQELEVAAPMEGRQMDRHYACYIKDSIRECIAVYMYNRFT